jgi:hypothetical protein
MNICFIATKGKSLYRRDFPLEKQSAGLFFNSPFSELPSGGDFALCGGRRWASRLSELVQTELCQR